MLATLAAVLGMSGAAQAVTVPTSIPSDCSTYVHTELNEFFKNVPDGSTIDFPTNGCYKTNLRVEVRNKANLTINGNGTWIKSDTENTYTTTPERYAIQPTVLLDKVDNTTVSKLNVEGNFKLVHSASTPRSQLSVNRTETCGDGKVDPGDENCAGSQGNSGYGIFGGSNIEIKDSKTFGTWGDGVQTSHSVIVDHLTPNETPKNIRLTRMRMEKAARMCAAPTQVDGYWLTDSVLTDCWYGGFDAESDGNGDSIKNINVLRNTWSDYFMFAVYVPVAYGDGTTHDIEVRDNVFQTRPDNYCNPIVGVGAYPTNPALFLRVAVDNNTFKARSGTAVEFDHIKGGSIQNNRDENYIEAGCTWPNAAPFSKVTNSEDVTIANNGPDAAGANLDGGTTPPPTTDPTPPPPTNECPTTEPDDPGVAAPTGVTASRTSGTQAVISWTHPGAAEYTVWVHQAAWDAPLAYSIAAEGSPRTLYGLDPSKSYTAYVTAKNADGTVSSPSETVEIPLP